MNDQRRNARLRTPYKGGRINFDGAIPGMDCIIKNLSEGGACLDVLSEAVPTDRFRLVIKPEFISRDCEVVWRRPQKIGVRFR